MWSKGWGVVVEGRVLRFPPFANEHKYPRPALFCPFCIVLIVYLFIIPRLLLLWRAKVPFSALFAKD